MHMKEGETPPNASEVPAYVDLDEVWSCLVDVRRSMRTVRLGQVDDGLHSRLEDLAIVSSLAASALALLDPVDPADVLPESGRAWVEIHKGWCRHFVAQAAMEWARGYHYDAVESMARAAEKLSQAQAQMVRHTPVARLA